MDVLIIANFPSNLSRQGNGRFLYLAELLAQDHAVELIASDFDHETKQPRNVSSPDFHYKTTLLHESGYPKNVCLKRFASHHEFGKNVAAYLKQRKKPDVIYTAVPSLTAPLEAAKYCKKRGVRFIIDVQDLWPEAFKMVFHVPVVSRIIFAPFNSIANRIYGAADDICAVSQLYVDRALSVNKKCKEGHSIYLGTQLSKFDELRKAQPKRQKPDGEVWMAYIGTLGSSYDLIGVLDAMALLRKENHASCLRFIVMGDGPQKHKFEDYARQLDVPVLFTGQLSYPDMVAQLCICDFAVNPIKSGSAGSIINKVGDYAAAGLAVVNTQECPEYRNLVTEYNMGVNCENGNIPQLADAIARLTENTELRNTLGIQNRSLAEERFDRTVSYERLKKLILEAL